jgi:hypothetical protein
MSAAPELEPTRNETLRPRSFQHRTTKSWKRRPIQEAIVVYFRLIQVIELTA